MSALEAVGYTTLLFLGTGAFIGLMFLVVEGGHRWRWVWWMGGFLFFAGIWALVYFLGVEA